MSGKKILRSKTPAPLDGRYAVVTEDGIVTDVIYRMRKGRRLPPTYKKRQSFIRIGPLLKGDREAA
jgi:hypothetical protein